MRRAFSDTLTHIAKKNEKLVFLTGDLGFQVFTEFEELFPERYINAGIAEAQLATCATGLALDGFRPVIYSIASFMTGRAFEQIRVSINYHKAPVLVVGAGGGYIYSNSGVTHHAAEDLALMSLLPDMQILNPGSPAEVTALLHQYFASDKPAYMRVGRFGEPEYDALEDIELGKARKVRDGQKLLLLSTGDCVIQSDKAAQQLQDTFGLSISHLQFHTLTPFDHETLDAYLSSYDKVIVVEDHFPQGGLYSRVMERIVQNPALSIELHRLGPSHELLLGAPSLSETKAKYGYNQETIFSLCKKLLNVQ